MKNIRRERGSATIEMTLIFPMLLFVIVVMLFFGIYLYEQVAVQAVLDDVTSRAAANWATADQGIYTETSNSSGFGVWQVYSRILDMNESQKKENLCTEALNRLRRVCLIQNTFNMNDIHPDTVNIVVYKSLTLTVTRTYPLPFPGFLRGMGLPTELKYQRTGTAIVQDAPELIRTMDIAGDILGNTKFGEYFKKLQNGQQQLVKYFQDFDLRDMR